MKNFHRFLLIFFLLTGFSEYVSAQIFRSSKGKTNFRLNFAPLFGGRLSGQYEYSNLRIGANANANISFAGQRTGFLAGANFRYFLSKERTSLFIGALGNYSDYSEDISYKTLSDIFEKSTMRGQALLVALNVGIRVNILRIFNFHARIGYAPPFVLDFKAGSENITQNDYDFYKNSFALKTAFDGEVSFGIRF